MPNELGPIRRSQAITTYGPGAIIDFRVGGHRGGPVSVLAAGLEQWDENASAKGMAHPQTAHEPRLERKLKVRGFRLPPVVVGGSRSEYEDQLVGVRFPRWLQCPRCNRLAFDGSNTIWQKAPGDARRYCPTCRVGNQRIHAVPVRLITACRNGHVDEFPWSYWVHGSSPDHEPDLRLVQGRGGGIGSLVVQCVAKDCQSDPRSLAGCFGKNALGLTCRGRRPWLEVDDSVCGEDLRTVQRGASNLYFSITESALDIPPWADRIQKQIGVYWSRIESQPTKEDRATLLRMLGLSEELGIPETDLLQAVEDRLGLLEITPGIREDEYRNFMEGQNPAIGSEVDFQIEPVVVPDLFKRTLGRLVKAKRLREVRVLRGFTRLEPYSGPEDDPRIAPIAANPVGWLPGIEIRGEGIFFALDPAAIRTWENSPNVKARVATLRARVPTDRKVDTAEATP